MSICEKFDSRSSGYVIASRRAHWPTAAAAAIYFAICLLVQWSAGAWSAPFTMYPDEPAHFVGSVMMRDYLTSGHLMQPLAFARMYYGHYPFFALGHWPPVFYLVSAVWYLLVGVGRGQALILQAAFATGTALLIQWFLRRRADRATGFCAGLVFLGIPEVQRWMCAVMIDHLVTLLCLATAACAIHYLQSPSLRNGIYVGLLASAAALSKYSGIYICALPLATIVIDGRFYLLRRLSFWIQPLLMTGTVWVWWLLTKNLDPYHAHGGSLTNTPVEFLQAWRIFPAGIAALVAVGLLLLLLSPREWKGDVRITVLLFLGLIAFLSLSGEDAERRYLLTGPAALIILAAAGWHALFKRQWPAALARFRSILPAAVAVSALGLCAINFSAFPHQTDRSIREAARLVSQELSSQPGPILLTTDMKGAVIAEVLLNDHHRPSFDLVRSDKSLASRAWEGENYAMKYTTVAALMGALRSEQIRFVLLHTDRREIALPHDVLLRRGLSEEASLWRTVPAFLSAGLGDSWTLLEYAPEHAGFNRSPEPPGRIR